MKYYFISDIHGCYDKMIQALNKAGFNEITDTIVSLGDPFDRGPQSYEILKYLMACPNRILIWGNHDYRLRNLILGFDNIDMCDYHNGVLQTMQSLCNNKNINDISLGIYLFCKDNDLKMRDKLLWKYFNECVWAIEFKDLIATHAWIPEKLESADTETWYKVSWSNTEEKIINKKFHPTKKILIGHWHAWRLRRLNEKKENDINFTTYETENYIAIDGCTNSYNGIVNVYVYETDEIPKKYN